MYVLKNKYEVFSRFQEWKGGYGNEVKGYRLYDMQTKRVFYSRDFLFNEVNQEHEMLTNASKPQEEKRYVSIEYLNDDEHDTEREVESLL